ncbi:hypothetical protein IQ07DRAFT_592333 [Pyrenochaeta sp. DS3sAY3a]|nr:hypothetical protein IQ07DRAFT_592333 [Pyrenochaeta sp. DS3sAY3a]
MVSQAIGTKKAVPVSTVKKTPIKAPPTSSRALQPAKKNPLPAPYKPASVAQKKPAASTAYKKPLPAPAKKTPPQQQGWLSKGISAASTGIGNAAGAVVSAAGNGVAGAGKGAGSSITNTSRSWGDVLREYGNSLKDVSGATGSRATTKSNPLGLSTNGAGAMASMGSRPGVTGSSVRSGTASNPLGL